MQWVFLIGKTISLDSLSKMRFKGSIDIRRFADQFEVVYGEKDHLIFCEDRPEKDEFEEDEYEELISYLPEGDPKWIMLIYRDIATLKSIIGAEDFPEDIIIDCDGVDLGLEDVIDKSRLINTRVLDRT